MENKSEYIQTQALLTFAFFDTRVFARERHLWLVKVADGSCARAAAARTRVTEISRKRTHINVTRVRERRNVIQT